MPLSQTDALNLIRRRAPAWREFQQAWRFYADSLEGGDRYRHADYLPDPFGPVPMPWYTNTAAVGGYDGPTGETTPFGYNQIVKRNLVPHLSEMSQSGSDLYAQRLHRTPVPPLVDWVVRKYLSRIYARQIDRTLPKQVKDWADDVDGTGTDLQCWLRKTVAPLLLAVGHLDLVFGHPPKEDGVEVHTRADSARLGLDRCVASFILPENLVWWALNPDGSYAEALVCERRDPDATDTATTPVAATSTPNHHWRHWKGGESNVYDSRGEFVAAESFEHPFGRVPIVRLFDHKKTRCRNVGQSRLESVAELQKSIYNRKSELVLSDILQSHAILQGPEEFVQGDAKITVGPGNVLPKKVSPAQDHYEDWSYLDNPKTGAESIRQHVQDEQEEAVLYASLLKPAGLTDGSVVSQSGISKAYDFVDQNDVLCEVAQTLGEAEEAAARMALVVLTDGKATPADLDGIEVEYPAEFGLFDSTAIAAAIRDITAALAAAGDAPETQGEMIARLVTVALPGIAESVLARCIAEVKARVTQAATEKATARAAALAAGMAPAGAASTVTGKPTTAVDVSATDKTLADGAGPGEL